MSKKMLIDASHPEETRVSVLSGGKVEDFDFESLSRRPLRGNIYLARITRVEPSLQAAFVEYGGNRHGFLAFSEIHPDYYQIPVSDREVLRKAEAIEAELAEKLAALSGDEEPDALELDEDDDDIRAFSDDADAEVDDDDDDDEPAEEEEEEEEREAEHGGDAGTPVKAEDAPADYAGEESAEDAGWHAIEEEEIAGLPKEEASHSPGPEADEPAAPAQSKGASTGTSETEALRTEDARVSTPADQDEDAEAKAEDGDETDQKSEGGEDGDARPRRRRRRGGRGRRRRGSNAEDTDSEDEDEGETVARHVAEDEEDAPESAPSGRKSGSSNPRTQEIADLERRYEEAKRERARLLRNYRIQEVIKRRQIMLVQAVKEERGNKGAALTTYLSLAGRYGVLMPNTARGGGVSRKITNAADRKRLRKAMSELDIPSGQGLIIRTAGAKRTKAEIKRDYDYLSRLWDTIRETTMRSVAPCLIYEEASLIKRAIRDLYDKDTGEILVQGEEGYREAKDFMKMLMPSHARNVQPYREEVPLFLKYHVEQQIDEMYSPTVKLKSGGYLVIQQTEALVSIDVNSGKSTKERNVEATALKTNLEAAEEVARQCKLRDLAGLVVIDFIDMDEGKNNRAVEKKLKDAMKTDRARIQLGSISNFGLLEFSRQRRRSGIVDGTTRQCPLCEGAGAIRSVEMAALRILRSVEEEAIKGKAGVITVQTAMDVALYVLNQKRDWLNRIEGTYGLSVEVTGDPHKNGDQFEITTRGEPRTPQSLRQAPRAELETLDDDEPAKADSDDGPAEVAGKVEKAEAEAEANDDSDEAQERNKKRRRRGRRGGRRNRRSEDGGQDEDGSSAASGDDKGETPDTPSANRPKDAEQPVLAEQDDETKVEAATPQSATQPVQDEATDDEPSKPEEVTSGEAESSDTTSEEDAGSVSSEDAEQTPDSAPAAEPVAAPEREGQSAPEPDTAKSPRVVREDTKPEGPKRGGWWQRALGR